VRAWRPARRGSFFAPLGREVPNLPLGIEEVIALAFCDHDVAKARQRLNPATVDETADRCDGKAQVIRSFWESKRSAFSKRNSVRSAIPLRRRFPFLFWFSISAWPHGKH
jgi:hypothetical protein